MVRLHQQQESPNCDVSCDISCDKRWDELQQTWAKSDQIVRKIIAHALKDPCLREMVKLDGKWICHESMNMSTML